MPPRTTLGSLSPRLKSDPLIGGLLSMGLPLTKAGYLLLMFGAEDEPTFPLDAETLSTIPPELEGKLPQSRTEYWAAAASMTSSSKARRPGARSRSTRA